MRFILPILLLTSVAAAQDRDARMSDRFDVFPDPPSVIDRPRSAVDPPPPPRQSLLDRVERDVDRGTGRAESDVTYELRQHQLDRDVDLGRRQDVSDFERFQDQRDRDLAVARARRQAERARQPRVVERESDALAAERLRFRRAVGAPGASGGAADRQALDRVRAEYARDLQAAEQTRADARAALDADPQLTPEQRIARSAEIDRAFDLQAQRLRDRYRQNRATILGVPVEELKEED